LSLALCNAVIIPVLVDVVAKFAYKETKSEEQSHIFVMNLIFMTINMIFLPLTGLISINDLLKVFLYSELDFVQQVSSHMGQMAAFFATYIMQTTFVSNCI
jgi:hypothetical protein